jgi:hypothetical protein
MTIKTTPRKNKCILWDKYLPNNRNQTNLWNKIMKRSKKELKEYQSLFKHKII